MAGAIIEVPANGAADWSDFVAATVRAWRGWMQVSLTNMDDTTEPAIAAGSALEVGGSIYQFASEEAITSWAGLSTSSDVWIKVVPSGTSITAVFTATPPTWSDAKQGWYATNDRYVAWLRKDSGDAYRYKHILPLPYSPVIAFEETIQIGDWNMDSTATLNITHELDDSAIVDVRVIVRNDADTAYYIGHGVAAAGTYLDVISAVGFSTGVLTIGRLPSGLFDAPSFDSTSYNRGSVIVQHRILGGIW